MKLTYTGRETKQLIEAMFPETHAQTVTRLKNDLHRLAAFYGSTIEQAYNKILVKGCKPATALFLFVALNDLLTEEQSENKRLLQKINALENDKKNIGNQLFILESSDNIGGKNDLRAVYIEQLKHKDEQIRQHTNALRVNSPQLITKQPNC